MRTWILKSEPETWSWDQQLAAGRTPWDGVRNYQAAKALQSMSLEDCAFFYHSGKQRCIVGIVRIVKMYYPDPSDPSGRFGMVDVETVCSLKESVPLSRIKADLRLHHLGLVRQSRLSVMPVDRESWKLLCEWGGIEPPIAHQVNR